MVLQLKKDNTGQYIVDYGITDTTKPAVTAGEFEAYSGLKDQTTLVGGTTLGEQTQKVMREAPGQVTTEVDPETGEVKTKTTGQQVEVEQKPITSLETQTGAAVQPTETPLEKAMRFASATAPSQQNQFDPNEYFSRIEAIQKNAQKAQLTNTLIKGGMDIGMTYLRGKLGGFSTGGIVQTPLSGGTYGTGGGFMSTPTGGGFADAGATLLQGGSVKDAAKVGAGTAVGTALGTAVGGPIGGAIGGAIGSIIGCFLPDTLIKMADGTEKKIIDINLKDNIEVGGFVFATGKFLVNNLFDYKGIKVSGEHLVNENGKWLKVKDSQFAKSLGNDEHIVYTLGSQNRRILINDILFTDYFDFEEQKTLAA
jgi:hypothetical protein